MIRKTILSAALLLLAAGTTHAESGFLNTDYSLLQAQASEEGTDRIFVAPGFDDTTLVKYDSVMVDQPEIHFSQDSEYKGLKPEDVAAIAGLLRDNVSAKLTERGYNVVEEPGPDVLYLRTALSDLYLKKKKRGLMSYTPVGIVVKAGTDALSETLEKVDILHMNLEAELMDSASGEVLGAVVLERGHVKAHGQKEERLDMDELRATVQEYANRFSCRLDNSRLPEAERVDCYDVAAREAREQGGA
jgi:hypothetical protein